MPFDSQCDCPYDPTLDLHVFLQDQNTPRVLGVLPPREDFGGLAAFAEAVPLIPRSQWVELDFSMIPVPILDQGQHGSCVGHGSAEAFWAEWLDEGMTPHDFSACWIYGEINGGRDGGAVISDSLDVLLNQGVCLLSEVPEGMIYKRQFPASAAQTAKRFRVKDAYHCKSFDELCTAAILGYKLVLGVHVGNNFTPGPDGIAGVSRGQGNHCLHSRGLKRVSGQWALPTQNSWGSRWGLNGWCYLVEAHFAKGNTPDWYAIKGVWPDPQDQLLPPEVI